MARENLNSILVGTLAILGFACIALPFVGGAQVDIDPINFQEAVTEAVHVACMVDGTSARSKEILVIAISKDNAKPMVNIRPRDQIAFGKGLTNRFKARGVIDNFDSANSYLNLTIGYPQVDDAGVYTCAFSYIDETGLLQQDKAHGQIFSTTSNSSSVEDDIAILKAKVGNLLERVTMVEKENLRLQTQVKNHSQQIDNLQDRGHYIVAFSVAVDKETTIVSGRRIVFPDVILNEGQGYNGTTGEFIAPRAGLYAFHLVLEIGSAGSAGEINLNVAGHDVARMYTQDKDYGDQSSVSSVSRLPAGAVVKAVVRTAAGSDPHVFGDRLCVFSGYLVSLS